MKNAKMMVWAVLIGLTSLSTLKAQTALHPWGVSADANFKEYNGEYGNGISRFLNPYIHPGVGVGYYLNNYFDANLSLNYGRVTHDPTPWIGTVNTFLEYKGLQATLSGRFKFNNGKMLKEDAMLGPYITAGLGFYTGKAYYPDGTTAKARMFNLPVGIGCNVNVSPRWKIFVQTAYLPSFTDKFDGIESGKRKDKLWEHKIGLTYNFGKGSEAAPAEEKAPEPAVK